MAVHEPAAGIVRLEGNDDICTVVGHDDIPSGRVIAAEAFVIGTCALDIVGAEAFVGLVDDGEVVAMEMDLRIGK